MNDWYANGGGAGAPVTPPPIALKPGPAKEKPYLRWTTFAGLPVTIDRPKGHVVEGLDSLTGQPYRTEYAVDYGYLRRTRGGDGEGLDVFLGPDEAEQKVFWVTQLKNDGSFDEFKLFLGYRNAVEAHAEYLRHYPARWYGGISEGTIHQVRALLCLHPELEIKSPLEVIMDVFESRMSLREWHDANTRLLDLGPSDVHISGAGKFRRGPPTRPKELMMSDLTAEQRDALPASQFAIPKERKYPIHDAAHVKAAAAYLEQEHNAGKVPQATYEMARGKIARAAKRFGIESEYNAKKKSAPGRRRIHVRADLADGGVLHVRQLKDGGQVLIPGGFQLPDELVVALKALDEATVQLGRLDQASDAAKEASARILQLRDASKAVWIQIGKTGYWAGHPQGPFALNEQIFQQIKRNFEATANHQIPVDFEHATEKPVTEGNLAETGAPAQGWIREMRIQGGNLFGLVEWGDKAREMIRAKEYKYMSPAIRFNSKDRETGELVGARMTSAALTNNPWIDGMQAVAAKDTAPASAQLELKNAAMAFSPSEYMPRVKAALKLPELCTAAECSDHLARLRSFHDADQGDDQDGAHDGVQLDDYRMPLRNLVGATPAQTWDDVFDAVEDMIDAAVGRHVVEDHDTAEGAALASAAITADDDDDGDDQSGEMTMAASDEKVTQLETDKATLLSDKKTLTTSVEALATEKKTLTERITALEAAHATEKTKLLSDASAAETDKTKLTLAVQELTGNLAKITEELKTLKDEKTKRVEADEAARVEKAFDDWKDKKNLTDQSKKGLLLILKNDPAHFETEYPIVKDSEKHLLHAKTVGKREAPVPPMPRAAGGGGPSQAPKPTLLQVAQRIASEKNLSLSDAMVVADEIWRRNRAADVTA